MKFRPYHVYGLLLPVLVIPAWRLSERPRREFTVSAEKVSRWASLARSTPEELERGVAHRYEEMAPALGGARDVGYFSENDKSDLWAARSSPAGHKRIERYYMAQSILAPSLLRFDELHALVVIDCATPEQAAGVLNREGLVVIRDFGKGLILARPES
jgi:hypothetical protein